MERRWLLSAQGVVFNDLDGSGLLNGSETGLPGRVVYVDLNNNGLLDAGEQSTLTDSTGHYELLTSSTATIRTVLPSGWALITTPFIAQGSSEPTYNLGEAQPMTINGTMTVVDGKGVTQPPLAGETVYEDLNSNGVLDAGEPHAFSGSDGTYSLAGVVPMSWYPLVTGGGELSLTLQPKANYVIQNSFSTSFRSAYVDNGVTFKFIQRSTQTMTVSGEVYADSAFAYYYSNSFTGLSGVTVYEDLNQNGIFDTGEPSAVTNSSGNYSITNVQDMAPSNPVISVVTPSGYIAEPPNGPSAISFSAGSNVAHSAGYTNRSFVTGIVWQVQPSVGSNPLTGATVYADLNGNGIKDAGEPSTVSVLGGGYFLGNLSGGTVTVRVSYPNYVGLDGEDHGLITFSSSLAGANAQWYLIATSNLPSTGTIEGFVYLDNNLNQQFDGYDSTQSGQTVYLDLNKDGRLDNSEPSVTTSGIYTFSGLAFGSYVVRLAPDASGRYVQDSPAQGAGITVNVQSAQDGSNVNFGQEDTQAGYNVGAYAFEDINGNGKYDPGEATISNITVYLDTNNNAKYDAGETSLQTTAGSEPGMKGGTLGPVTIRAVSPFGQVQTLPAPGSGYSFNVPSYATNYYVGFAFTPSLLATGSIAGQVFYDSNGDRIQDDGESVLSNAQVYIDANDNGIYDAGDLLGVSNSSGFVFDSIPVGTYTVRQILNTGYVQSSPSGAAGITVTVTADQTSSINFGADNPEPAANITAPSSVAEGSSITFSSDGSTDINAQLANFEWDFNYNGTTFTDDATGASAVFSAAALDGPSTCTVALRVTDTLGVTSVATQTVEIINVPPTGTLNGSSTTVGSTGIVTFTNVTDPSIADTTAGFTYSYDFNNDGVYDLTNLTGVATVPASFLPTVGTYAIAAKIADKDGGFTLHTTAVVVNAAAVSGKLAGTAIGTSGSYQNDGNTVAKALDGNLATFFDGPTANGNWVGLDLGTPMVITSLAYASRSGYASRMNSGIFQASNSADFSSGVVALYTIGANANPSSGSLTTQTVNSSTAYRYVRYLSPANSYGDVAEVQFFGYAPVVQLPNWLSMSNGSVYNYSSSGLTVTSGTALILGDPSSTAANFAITALGTSTVQFWSTARIGVLTLNDTSIAVIQGTGATLAVTSLSLSPSAKLDLKTSSMIIDYVAGNSPQAAVAEYLKSGLFGNGSAGLLTTAYSSPQIVAVGLLDNALLTSLGNGFTTFGGVPVDSTSLLIKYTYFGDSNFDGKVDGSDYSRIDSGFLTHGTGWSNGDFNYDGVVNGSDYTLIDNAFNRQGVSLATQIARPAQVVLSTAANSTELTDIDWLKRKPRAQIHFFD